MQSFDFTVESVISATSQIVDLTEGWSIISTYINPYIAILNLYLAMFLII